jgi:hypothetical protein
MYIFVYFSFFFSFYFNNNTYYFFYLLKKKNYLFFFINLKKKFFFLNFKLIQIIHKNQFFPFFSFLTTLYVLGKKNRDRKI